mmetsp:Transcript_99575/g.286333  ORF Transcript_99575/g.286333 Transcript_99575/m.286333 type:complete len:98 (-) Transcript_99575:42-335(-)
MRQQKLQADPDQHMDVKPAVLRLWPGSSGQAQMKARRFFALCVFCNALIQDGGNPQIVGAAHVLVSVSSVGGFLQGPYFMYSIAFFSAVATGSCSAA